MPLSFACTPAMLVFLMFGRTQVTSDPGEPASCRSTCQQPPGYRPIRLPSISGTEIFLGTDAHRTSTAENLKPLQCKLASLRSRDPRHRPTMRSGCRSRTIKHRRHEKRTGEEKSGTPSVTGIKPDRWKKRVLPQVWVWLLKSFGRPLNRWNTVVSSKSNSVPDYFRSPGCPVQGRCRADFRRY